MGVGLRAGPHCCAGADQSSGAAPGGWGTHVDPYNRVRPGARHHPVQQRQRRGRAIQRQAPAQRVFQHHPTVTRDHRAQDRISSRRHRRHGQPELAEAPAALLAARHGGPNLCLPSGLSILTGWPLRARPRPALTLWAQGLANFSPSRSPTGRWENCAPEPCTPAASTPVLISVPDGKQERAATPQTERESHHGSRTRLHQRACVLCQFTHRRLASTRPVSRTRDDRI